VHAARVLVDPSGEPVRDERLTSLASEAQSLARASEGQVVASAIAARLIRSDFTLEELPAAGRAAPEGARVITAGRTQATIHGRFVGRHEELKRLGDILAAATRRKPQLITLSGEKGVGKTRVVTEMERRLHKGNYNVGFYVAACERNGADVPWSGLTAMLQILCGVQEGDDEGKIREIIPRLRALGLQAEESDAVLAQLGATPENRSSGAPRDPSGPLRSGFAKMLQSLTDDRLHILVWDDAHVLDAASLGAILHAVERGRAREASGLRAVLVFATREEPNETVAADPNHHALTVGELGEDDAARLISTRIGARLLPPELLGFCRDRAGGHPLFLEELLRELGDSGAITVLNGEVKTRLDGATAVPRTLRLLITARVSRLDPAERAAMQAAAILGEPIFIPVLAALLKQSLPQVDKTIAALAARDLLRVTGPAQAAFASPTHGEIVLDAIPPEARRELHAAAAAAYDAAFGDSGEHAERVARHLYEAGDRDRAAGAYAKAARERLRVNQLELAIRWFVRALDLAAIDRRPCDEIGGWLQAIGDAATRVRMAANLADVVGPALRRLDAAGTIDERVKARIDVACAFGAINLFEDAQKRLDEALQLAGDRGDLRQRALLVEVETAARSGDFMRAIGAATRAEALGPLKDPRILISLAHARATQGDQKSALRALDQAGQLVDPNDLDLALEREKVRVLVYLYTGAFADAVEASSLALDLARALGARFNLAAVLHNLGDASRRAGDLPRAYASLSESKDIGVEAGFERLVMLNRAHLTYLEGLNGDAAAEGVLRQLIGYHESRNYHTDALESRVLLGALLRRKKRSDEARRELDEVLRRAIALGNRLIAEDARHEMSMT
jgi:tetratricopeptide (TPR) repeat protein